MPVSQLMSRVVDAVACCTVVEVQLIAAAEVYGMVPDAVQRVLGTR